MIGRALGLTMGLAGLVAGCAAVPSAEEREARLAAEIEARQGEQIDRICFSRSIDSWREFGDDDVLVREGVNDWYRLELSGTCDPGLALTTIGLRTSGGSSCLHRGDRVVTNTNGFPGRCFITAIYEWDEAAAFAWPVTEDEASAEES